MRNHDDIWKKMTTPKEMTPEPWQDYGVVEGEFQRLRQSGVCIKCPMSGTIYNMPYRRSISKAMAQALKQLYLIQIGGINDGVAPNSFSDFAKLRHWNMIRNDGEKGHWRITDTGIAFVRGIGYVKKYAIVLNNKCVQFLGDDLSINDILDK